MRVSRKFVRGGPTLTTFLLANEGSEKKRAIIGWRADDGPILNTGLVACDFSGDPDQ